MVELARLESVYTRKGIKGSNPFSSAMNRLTDEDGRSVFCVYPSKYEGFFFLCGSVPGLRPSNVEAS